MVETVKRIVEILELNEIETSSIDNYGVIVPKHVFIQIVDVIYRQREYSSVRGHVKLDECFNVSYETNYFSYERLSDEFYLGNATISYKKSEEYKVYISNYNWIDLHINYSENSYATVVIVPK